MAADWLESLGPVMRAKAQQMIDHVIQLIRKPGIRVDEKGNLYVAAKSVFIYAPDGALLRTIEFHETPSNLAFGDPDFATLYITARTSVYRVRLGVKGAVPYFP